MKKGRTFLFMALLAMMSVIGLGIVGCGSDDEEDTGDVVTPTTTSSTRTDDTGGEDIVQREEPDFAAEKEAVLAVWAEFMELYNEREMKDIKKLWTNAGSDFIFINISDNERIDAQGGAKVQETLFFLTNGHHSTKNDRWTGGNMTEVWIRKKGGKLQASAHGPNALRQGESWAYFEKERDDWLINKVESIETRNLAKHVKVEIGEDQIADGRGFFDDDEYLVP